MNSKAAKFISDGLKKAVTSFFKSKAAGADKAAIGKEVEAAFNQPKASSAISKWLKPLLIANVADSYIYDIPVAGELLKKLVEAHGWVINNTIGKIPGIGPVLIKAGTFGSDVVTPNTAKHFNINDPKYYENVDMHLAFNIPFNYPDTDFLDYGSGVNYASICVLNTAENHMSDEYAVKSRITQVYDLLKGVRGLSGKQPYSTGDLYYYHIQSKYLLNEYCRLKFALRLAQLYIMTKSRMPHNLLRRLGWNPDDFIANRAMYKEALVTLANYITNTHPIFGVDLDRIQGLWTYLIPDSNDNKVALFYKVSHHITALIPEATNSKILVYSDFFHQENDATPGDPEYNIYYVHTVGQVYSTYITQMLSYIEKLTENDQFNPIRADLVGAFGQSIVWTDPKINEIDDKKFDDIIAKFDELYLTVIQNATILDQKGFTTAGQNDASLDHFDVFMNLGTFNTDGSIQMPSANSGNNAAVRATFIAQNTSGTAGNILLPQTDGAAIVSTNGAVITDSTIVIGNKYGYKESEQIELLQLMAFCESITSNYANNQDYLYVHYITQSMCVLTAEILYFNPANKTDSITSIRSRLIVNNNTPAAYNDLAAVMEVAQFWSQSDYGPKVAFGAIDYNTGTTKQYLLLDMNIMGSISRSAFLQSVRYATYSLLHANIKITEAKKLGNIVDIYNVKQR